MTIPRDPYAITDEDLDEFFDSTEAFAKARGVTVASVIAARHALQLRRRNDLYVENGNILDEGIARELQALTVAVKRFVSEH